MAEDKGKTKILVLDDERLIRLTIAAKPLILPADAIPRWLAPAADPAPLLPLALSSLAATPSP